jgi:hypothetical protein
VGGILDQQAGIPGATAEIVYQEPSQPSKRCLLTSVSGDGAGDYISASTSILNSMATTLLAVSLTAPITVTLPTGLAGGRRQRIIHETASVTHAITIRAEDPGTPGVYYTQGILRRRNEVWAGKRRDDGWWDVLYQTRANLFPGRIAERVQTLPYTVDPADVGWRLVFTATGTLTIPTGGTLENGFVCELDNQSAGAVTLSGLTGSLTTGQVGRLTVANGVRKVTAQTPLATG